MLKMVRSYNFSNFACLPFLFPFLCYFYHVPPKECLPYKMNLLVAVSTGATEIENTNQYEFLQTLDEMERQFPVKKEYTAWEKRKQNMEENWAKSRAYLFNCLIEKESIPGNDKGCERCTENIAVLHCTTCQKVLCSECDNLIHCDFPFHDRQIWINGFFEGIPNNQTLVDGILVPVGMRCHIHICFNLSLMQMHYTSLR